MARYFTFVREKGQYHIDLGRRLSCLRANQLCPQPHCLGMAREDFGRVIQRPRICSERMLEEGADSGR